MLRDPGAMNNGKESGALRDAPCGKRLSCLERSMPLKRRNTRTWSIKKNSRRGHSAAHGEAGRKCGPESFWKKRLSEGSLALETAAALPLFLFAMLTMISFQEIYSTRAAHLTRVCQDAMKRGLYTEAGEITLSDAYTFRPPCLLFCPAVSMENHVTIHTWSGADYGSMTAGLPDETDEKMVYVTEHGSVVHLDAHCTYLDLSVSCVSAASVDSLRNVYGEKYHPCETCSHSAEAGGSVYITEKGNRFHSLGSCSGLKRTVHLVKQSEAGDRRICSRCGSHDHGSEP